MTGAGLGAAPVLIAELLHELTTQSGASHAMQLVIGGSLLSAGYAVLGRAI
jgi:hypothetical protein